MKFILVFRYDAPFLKKNVYLKYFVCYEDLSRLFCVAWSVSSFMISMNFMGPKISFLQ